jgi:hypothetical protein
MSIQRGNQFRKDLGERCAASRAFNGSSPTANLVSIIKGQRVVGIRLRRVKRLVARARFGLIQEINIDTDQR